MDKVLSDARASTTVRRLPGQSNAHAAPSAPSLRWAHAPCDQGVDSRRGVVLGGGDATKASASMPPYGIPSYPHKQAPAGSFHLSSHGHEASPLLHTYVHTAPVAALADIAEANHRQAAAQALHELMSISLPIKDVPLESSASYAPASWLDGQASHGNVPEASDDAATDILDGAWGAPSSPPLRLRDVAALPAEGPGDSTDNERDRRRQDVGEALRQLGLR